MALVQVLRFSPLLDWGLEVTRRLGDPELLHGVPVTSRWSSPRKRAGLAPDRST